MTSDGASGFPWEVPWSAGIARPYQKGTSWNWWYSNILDCAVDQDHWLILRTATKWKLHRNSIKLKLPLNAPYVEQRAGQGTRASVHLSFLFLILRGINYKYTSVSRDQLSNLIKLKQRGKRQLSDTHDVFIGISQKKLINTWHWHVKNKYILDDTQNQTSEWEPISLQLSHTLVLKNTCVSGHKMKENSFERYRYIFRSWNKDFLSPEWPPGTLHYIRIWNWALRPYV